MHTRIPLLLASTGLLALTACSPGDDGGSSSTSTSGASSGASASGGSSAGTSGGTSAGSTGGSGGSGTSGDISGFDPTPKPKLDGGDGITATVAGTTYSCTASPRVLEGTTHAVAFQVTARCSGSQTGDWTLTMPTTPGTYACDTQAKAGEGKAAGIAGPTGTGTALGVPGSSCTMVVKQTLRTVEGSFTGTLSGIAGSAQPLTAGYFYFSNGRPDCSLGIDPGIGPTANAASVAITEITGSQGKLRCGGTSVLENTGINNGDVTDDPEVQFTAPAGSQMEGTRLSIRGMRKTGTFNCGASGNPGVANAKPIGLTFGVFDLANGGPGPCTVTVDKYEANLVEGSFKATLWSAPTLEHNTATFEGHFRSPRTR